MTKTTHNTQYLKKLKAESSKLKANAGFTLIETLVAISILLISISAPLTIAARGLASSYFARDQITAFYLAQDAVEYIRNKRDENFLSNLAWLSGIPDATGARFIVDTTNGNMTLCPVDGCGALLYNTATGFYGYDDPEGVESKFVRSVSVETISAEEAVIEVSVSWSTGALERSFSVTENIFDWQ